MKIRPLHDRVLVQRLEEEEVSQGGIIIPDTAKEQQQEGEVLAVGPGRRLENGKRVKPDVKIGDRVLFSKYGGTEIEINHEEVTILKENDILGIINK